MAAIDLERAAATLERMAQGAADVLAHLPAERVDGVLCAACPPKMPPMRMPC